MTSSQQPAAGTDHPDLDEGSRSAYRGRFDFADAVRDHTAEYIDRRKGDAVGAISDVADAIRAGGDSFKDMPNLKAFFDQAAEGVDELAGTVQQRSFGEIYAEVEAAARRRPLLTGAAAVVAGFALYRFFQDARVRPLPRSRAVVPVEATTSLAQG